MFSKSLNISRLIIVNNPVLILQRYFQNTIFNPTITNNHAALLLRSQNHLNQNITFASIRNLSNEKSISKSKNESSLKEEEDDILYKSIHLEARSADKGVLDSYEKFVLMTAKFMDIQISRVWEPFRSIKRRTLLRAAFVKKKYRVQYEFRTYFRSIELKYLTGSTADTFLEYVERNLPEGTALKVTRQRIEKIPEHLKPPSQPVQQ